LVVLWEASDRVCGKRLKPLVPILVDALAVHAASRHHQDRNRRAGAKNTPRNTVRNRVKNIASGGNCSDYGRLTFFARKLEPFTGENGAYYATLFSDRGGLAEGDWPSIRTQPCAITPECFSERNPRHFFERGLSARHDGEPDRLAG
jgi:hypothetical protein